MFDQLGLFIDEASVCLSNLSLFGDRLYPTFSVDWKRNTGAIKYPFTGSPASSVVNYRLC